MMKKFLFALCIALLPALTFMSCSSDDDTPAPALAPTIEGDYPVNIYIGLETDPDMNTPYDGTVSIMATEDNKVSLSLEGFSMGGGQTIPISLSGISTAGSVGSVLLSYDGVVESPALEAMGIVKTVLVGSIRDGVLDFVLPVNIYSNDNPSHLDLTVNVLLQSKTE